MGICPECEGTLDGICCECCKLPAETERLRAIEDKLPITADGIRVVPVRATKVYRILSNGRIQESNGWSGEYPTFRCADKNEPSYGDLIHNIDLCFSSREAAEAAQKVPS